MSKKRILFIAIAAIGVILIYSIDLFKLNYRLKDWNEFGDTPIAVSHVQYLTPDTPDIISYNDRALGENVTCYEAVAFVQSDAQESYRCCDAEGKISCLAGDFSGDILPVDEQCVAELKNIFGVPDMLAGSREYNVFGSCSGGRFAELTVVQLNNEGRILWKYLKVDPIQVLTSALRCVLGPILLLLILYILYGIYQEKTAAPVRRI